MTYGKILSFSRRIYVPKLIFSGRVFSGAFDQIEGYPTLSPSSLKISFHNLSIVPNTSRKTVRSDRGNSITWVGKGIGRILLKGIQNPQEIPSRDKRDKPETPREPGELHVSRYLRISASDFTFERP